MMIPAAFNGRPLKELALFILAIHRNLAVNHIRVVQQTLIMGGDNTLSYNRV